MRVYQFRHIRERAVVYPGGTGPGEQVRDLLGAVAGLREHLGGVLAQPRRIPAGAGSLAVDSDIGERTSLSGPAVGCSTVSTMCAAGPSNTCGQRQHRAAGGGRTIQQRHPLGHRPGRDRGL